MALVVPGCDQLRRRAGISVVAKGGAVSISSGSIRLAVGGIAVTAIVVSMAMVGQPVGAASRPARSEIATSTARQGGKIDAATVGALQSTGAADAVVSYAWKSDQAAAAQESGPTGRTPTQRRNHSRRLRAAMSI